MILSFCTSAPDRLNANDEFYINPNLFTVMLSRWGQGWGWGGAVPAKHVPYVR